MRFEDVTFAYPGADVPALAGVDLDVPAGTTLALVGETGSGKSTLASLVARLLRPDRGRGSPSTASTCATSGWPTWPRSSAWSARRPTCCTRPCARTCATPSPDATDAEIEDAARAAQIHDLIAALPDGYDTVVGSRGHRFSGGEKQRIAIARTLLRNPRILVLDEATSALDTETERAVQQAFDTLAEGRTTITIAHRLSTVRDADQIVVLDHGRVLEPGTHDALLADEGRYAALAA